MIRKCWKVGCVGQAEMEQVVQNETIICKMNLGMELAFETSGSLISHKRTAV